MARFFPLFYGLLALLAQAAVAAPVPKMASWPTQAAGVFYPADAAALRAQIAAFPADNALPAPDGDELPLALVAPHAGYRHSGAVAASGYRAVAGRRYARAIVIANSHFREVKPFRGASVLNAAAFATPLGEVRTDATSVDKILSNAPRRADGSAPLVASHAAAYAKEHSLEVQLPLLKQFVGDVPVIPVMLGVADDDDLDRIAAALKPFVDADTLLVASSDFTHYGRVYGFVPFSENILDRIHSLDEGAFSRILAKDPAGLKSYRDRTGLNACGIGAIRLLLKLLPEAAQGRLIAYDTLGRQSGNPETSVSYASLAFFRSQKPDLSEAEKGVLLAIARDALEDHVKTGARPRLDLGKYALTPRLKELGGAFVSLYKNEGLRGCMGHTVAQVPLYQSVIDNAVNAASKDGRFTPVKADELSALRMHVSVLSPLHRIEKENYDVLRDGILLKKGDKRAVFLPGVASGNKWNRGQTFVQLCLKAGLPVMAWREPDAEFYAFRTLDFDEKK